MIVNKTCEECGKEFEYDEKPGYPRKYCFSCGAARKKRFAERQEEKPEVVKPGLTPSKPNNHATMYTSYAKDVFIALNDKLDTDDGKALMAGAIELVKQAKAAFE